MVQLMTIDQLVGIADAAGIRLTEVGEENEHNLYVITDPGEINLYVGKSTSQKGDRTDRYRAWAGLDHTRAIHSGIVALLRRSEEHTSELQSRGHLVCRLLLEKKRTPVTCTST